MGKLLFQLDRFEEALAAFETGARSSPADADVRNSRAGALRGWAVSKLPAEAAREALTAAAGFAEAALNLGTALLKLGRHEEALAAYRRASDSPRPIMPTRSAAQRWRCAPWTAWTRRAPPSPQPRRWAAARRSAGSGCLDLMLGRFRARLGGLRGALDRGQIARRRARRALSRLVAAPAERRARAGA